VIFQKCESDDAELYLKIIEPKLHYGLIFSHKYYNNNNRAETILKYSNNETKKVVLMILVNKKICKTKNVQVSNFQPPAKRNEEI
jgi:hypothetical protein